MKAAIVEVAGQTPRYGDFVAPQSAGGRELIVVRAAALTHLTKGRASGAHYSADGAFPAVVGVDGVGETQDGRRVYFVLPEAPYGAMAEVTRVRSKQCIVLPDGLDDVTAAAVANPGMSAWAALAERAQVKAGETVLINGATGIAGRLAVQIAKYMGAAKVIATGRDGVALEEVRALGADVMIPFRIEGSGSEGAKAFEAALIEQFAAGVNVVVDYLWGKSAETIMMAIATGVEDAKPVRFIHVGGASGDDVQLPGAALRSSSIVLMGSGLKSVPMERLLAAIGSVFEAVGPAKLRIATKVVPLADVEKTWEYEGKARVVFVMG
ncbi:quinone oxidoreductase family protein [Granulicella arctica]|uniref:quinone oxidoreductase family protein n=1 Tax=Granulicella arctica TaxID=940613 RepID=UPI0021E0443A|nr:zinc-binding alcohol dehydrogenase family protein [Granulicella arctica]